MSNDNQERFCHYPNPAVTEAMLEDAETLRHALTYGQCPSATAVRNFLVTRGINTYDQDIFEHSHRKSPDAFLGDKLDDIRALCRGLATAIGGADIAFSVHAILFYIQNGNGIHLVGAIKMSDFGVTDQYTVYGNDEFRKFAMAYLDERLVDDDTVLIKRVKADQKTGRLHAPAERIAMPSACDRPDLFYPNLPTPASVWEGFTQSSSRVLLLQGDVGTGKSSYLRDLLQHRGWDETTYIIDHSKVHDHEELGDYLRGLPDDALVIFEDADALLGKRTSGNTVMSAILNSTSGIASTGVRLVFTTNLPNLKSVDGALLRSGRTYRLLEFGDMSGEQAAAVRAHVGKNPDDLDREGRYSLADAINYEEIRHDLERHGFGFAG